MARACDDGSSQYLQVTQTVVHECPFTISAWAYPRDTGGHNIRIYANDSHYFGLQFRDQGAAANPGSLRAWQRSPTTRWASTGNIWSPNAWNHGLVMFINNRSRWAKLNGGTWASSATDAGDDTGGINKTIINGNQLGVASGYADWAEIGIWNIGLDDSEVAALAAGASPLCIRPGSLKFYYPLVRDDRCLVSDYDLVSSGNPTIAAHCRVLSPSCPQVGARDRRIPRMMHSYRRRRVA